MAVDGGGLDRGALRRRKGSDAGGSHPAAPRPVGRGAKTPVRGGQRGWGTVVRWVARALLVLVVVLSSIRVVEISGPFEGSGGRGRGAGVGATTVVLVITHSRGEYLRRCLESLRKHHPRDGGWTVLISEDRQKGVVEEVRDIVQEFIERAPVGMGVTGLGFDEEYVRDVEDQGLFINTDAYRKITRHYGWALGTAFEQPSVERVVVVEDDMEVAVDFYEYFGALAPILDNDESLFCISAWNDNGKEDLAKDPEQLYRTDYFPGLGWMLTRKLWETELRDKWPRLYWDDWMRSANQTRGRQCIRPEVSRTANFGAKGVSKSFAYERHISKVVLNEQFVNFSSLDLGYLEAARYHEIIFGRMSNATLLRFSNFLGTRPQAGDVIARYPVGKLDVIGRRTGIMSDHRNGIWRTSYKGVVVVPWNGYWAFFVDRKFKPPEGYRLGSRECCDL